MYRSILARDIMVTKLVTLSPEMDAFEAIGLLLKHQISGAPVVSREGNYLGVFSEKSCMSILVKAAYDQMPGCTVMAFVDRDARTIDEETDLLTIAQIFSDTSSRRLPVLDDGMLVGQISRRDVLRAVHNMIRIAPDYRSALLYLSSLVEPSEAPIG